MRRFLVLALPLLVLTRALFELARLTFGLARVAASSGPGQPVAPLAGPLPGWVVAGGWCLEALALAALFLLVQGRGSSAGGAGTGYWNGLLAGWTAWVFRGPLLVVSVAEAGVSPGPWWSAALSWLAFYTVGGLLLGLLAQATGLRA